MTASTNEWVVARPPHRMHDGPEVTHADAAPTRTTRTIHNRLVIAVSALVVVTAVLTIGGFATLSSVVSGIDEENRQTDLLVEADTELRVQLAAQQASVLRHALAPTRDTRQAFERAVDAEAEAYFAITRSAPDDLAIRSAVATTRRQASQWRDTFATPLIRGSDAIGPAGAATALVDSDRAFGLTAGALASLNRLVQQRHEAASQALRAMVDDQQQLVVPIVVVVSLATALAGMWLMRSISGPLHRLNVTAQALTTGKAVAFVPEQDDEIGALATVLERMRTDAASRYERARSEAETAALFNQLAELMTFAQDEQTLVDAAALMLQRVAPSPTGQVLLLNNSTNRLMVAATWGEGLQAIGDVVGVDRPDRCPGIRRAAPFVSQDVSDRLSVQCPAHPAEQGSVVCLPMSALGSVVGVVHLERPAPDSFDVATVHRAARTVEQVALALANARLMKTMEGLANTDPLTGLRNARFFDSYLEHEFALAERDGDSIGLIMLDVDHFKQFNDTNGHPAGDEALKALARTLRGTVRASDVVSRYGGEEFIIAVHHATLTEAAAIAEKIRLAVEQMLIDIGPGRSGRITASLGVAATDTHHVDRKGLVSLADAALYRAKDAGRNRVETAIVPGAVPQPGMHEKPILLPSKPKAIRA